MAKQLSRRGARRIMLKTGKRLSGNVVVLLVAASVAVGYFAGTRNDQILSVIGPVFGYKIYASDIDLSSVQATYKALKANYDGTLDDNSLIEGANKGLVDATGDNYTSYMTSAEASAFQDDLSGTIGGGIGAEIGLRNGNVTIVRVLKSNPAVAAGLKDGDTILKVNDQSTSGWTVEQAVAQIRGEPGTTVKLLIERDGEAKEHTVTRDIITNPSVDSSITDGVGTITISRFDNQTTDLVRAVAQDFKDQGVRAIILDLRNNGGGYVDAAQAVVGLWVDNKVVVTERANGQVVTTLKSGSNPLLADIPTVVLVNYASASSSEIVAGALQDYGVAKLVGEKTFGKGSVQKLVALPEGAELKVTVARWYTPNGRNIMTEGIMPDSTVSLSQADVDAGNDPQLSAAKKQLGL
jgi:carboxyl-terminal processing protease